MNNSPFFYVVVMLIGVFLSSVSQVMLKKAAEREYPSRFREYLNPLVISAYAIYVLTTLMTVYAYKALPLSTGSVLTASGYIYVTVFGTVIFKEKITVKKILALGMIICGIVIYSLVG